MELLKGKCRQCHAANSFRLDTRTCIWFATWSDLICFAKDALGAFCQATVKSPERPWTLESKRGLGFRSSGPSPRISTGNLGQVWTSRPSAASTQVPVVPAALHSGRRQSAASAGYSPVGIDITVQMRRSMALTRQRACIAKVAVWWEEKKTIRNLNWGEKERIIWRVNVVEIATLSRRGWLLHQSKPLPVGWKNDVKLNLPVFSNSSKCHQPVSGRPVFCVFFCLFCFLHHFSENVAKNMSSWNRSSVMSQKTALPDCPSGRL